jgi:hypothetical protein
MGLHAQIHQANQAVSIALCGEFRAPEFAQLEAILSHFHDRGCRKFLLDLRQVTPLTAAAAATLRLLIGQPDTTSKATIRASVIRLLADSPAALPQTGCGGHIFSVAS